MGSWGGGAVWKWVKVQSGKEASEATAACSHSVMAPGSVRARRLSGLLVWIPVANNDTEWLLMWIYEAGWWRDVFLQTEQRTIWGQGLQGLKVTSLLGFLWPASTARSGRETWAHETIRTPVSNSSEFAGKSSRGMKKKPRNVCVWDQTTTWDLVFVSGFWGHPQRLLRPGAPLLPLPLLASPHPHKEREKKKKKMLSQFHARQNFLFAQQRGQHLRAKVRSDVGSFLYDSLKWMKTSTQSKGRLRAAPAPFCCFRLTCALCGACVKESLTDLKEFVPILVLIAPLFLQSKTRARGVNLDAYDDFCVGH